MKCNPFRIERVFTLAKSHLVFLAALWTVPVCQAEVTLTGSRPELMSSSNAHPDPNLYGLASKFDAVSLPETPAPSIILSADYDETTMESETAESSSGDFEGMASGTAKHTMNAVVNPDTGQFQSVSGTITGSGKASMTESAGSSLSGSRSSQSGSLNLGFEVKDEPVTYTLTYNGSGTWISSDEYGRDAFHGSLNLRSLSFQGFSVDVFRGFSSQLPIHGEPPTYMINGSETGALEPGHYQFFVSARTVSSLQRAKSGLPISGITDSSVVLTYSLTIDSEPAEDILWKNTDGGNFAEEVNWDPQRVPLSDDQFKENAVFEEDASYTVNIPSATTERIIVRDGEVNFLVNGAGTYAAVALPLSQPSVDIHGGALLKLLGGTLNSVHASIGSVEVEGEPPPSGEFHVLNDGTQWNTQGRISVGEQAPGYLFIANQAEVKSKEARIGAGSEGTAILGGRAKWNAGNVNVGYASPGTLNIESLGTATEITVFTGETVFVGDASTGTIVVDGPMSDMNLTEELRIGLDSNGEFEIRNGGNVLLLEPAEVLVGAQGPGTGKLTIAGSSSMNRSKLVDWDGNGSIAVGDENGVGELLIEDGGLLDIQRADIGYTGTGTATVRGYSNGNPSQMSVEEFEVGSEDDSADGTLRIEDGGLVKASIKGTVANDNGTQGNLIVSGVHITGTPSTLQVGGEDFGFFDIGPRGEGTVRIENGGLIESSAGFGAHIFLGYESDGDGKLEIAGYDSGTGKRSELTGNEGILALHIANHGLGKLEIADGGLVDCVSVDVGKVSGAGGVLVSGTGNGHPSHLRIRERLCTGLFGAVGLEDGGAITIGDVEPMPGKIVVGPGGQLSGYSYSTVVNSGGMVTPGCSIGTMTIDGDFTAEPGSYLVIEVSGNEQGVGYDQLVVTGDVDFRGKVVLKFIDGYVPSAGEQFEFIDARGDATIEIEEVLIPNLEPGFEYGISLAGGKTTLNAVSTGVYLPPAELRLTPELTESREFQIHIEGGSPGDHIVIEWSTDLDDWERIHEVIQTVAVPPFAAPNSESESSVFYRVLVNPPDLATPPDDDDD